MMNFMGMMDWNGTGSWGSMMNSFGTYGWLGMMAGFGLFGLVVFAAFSIFWLWMLIDLLQRKTPDKLVWVLVLIFLNFLGAVLYYLLVYSKGKRR